jgi:hypothetical protein
MENGSSLDKKYIKKDRISSWNRPAGMINGISENLLE